MHPERAALIAAWKERLDTAHEAYLLARAQAWSAQAERKHLPAPDGQYAVTRSNIAEIAAQRHYRDVLKIYTDITVYGKRPPEC